MICYVITLLLTHVFTATTLVTARGNSYSFSLVNNAGEPSDDGTGLLIVTRPDNVIGTVCDDSFSDVAASAICNEMGYNSSAIMWANSNLWDSVQQSYEIALDDVECQTDNFAECTYATSNNCGHSEDLYLTCDHTEWTAVGEREVLIAYDLESNPLQIVTDSVVGSEDMLRVEFQPEEGRREGHDIKIQFTNPPRYQIGLCTSDWVTFTLPEEQIRTWTISEEDSSVLALFCNGVEIFNYPFSEFTDEECLSRWSKDAVNMVFKSDCCGTDTASDEYRAKPTVCEDFPESWTAVTTELKLPVSHGTTMNVSCQEGYKNTGSDVITCDTYLYNDYSYTLEPLCIVNTCNKPVIANGVVSPADATVDYESIYTVACNTGYTANATDDMNCTASGELDAQHSCEINTCNKPVIANGIVSPANATVDYESIYTVACNTGYTANATDDMNCTASGELDAQHSCEKSDSDCDWSWGTTGECYAMCNDKFGIINNINITGITLSGGEAENVGYVVAISEGTEVVLCNHGIGRNEINAICRELGYTEGMAVDANHYNSNKSLASYQFGVTDIMCPEDAAGLSDCQWTAYEEASVPCFDGQQVAVSCSDGTASSWVFEISEFSTQVKTSKRGTVTKVKAACSARATQYGTDIDLKSNTVGLLANFDSNGTLSLAATMKYKANFIKEYFYGEFTTTDPEPNKKSHCFVCVVATVNGGYNADLSHAAYQIDEDCKIGSITATDVETQIGSIMQP